ncbi:hypothetical protein [Cesiribacter andamanensis]|uniref:Lipoprotein n=1 Tax=Cesiribacter andamanensis AMV16 TaxID=1279009 RepID=M7NLH4_9BACT|nr:hypothetical protein [Cesiribacter andamanensis]EMR02635.1 hypothetical protein ADICEAN_02234 [Cesiribacter andamanensis AMV16]
MKKFLFYAGALALLATTSCKDDEGGGPTPNTVMYNGNSYAVNAAMVEDYGPASMTEEGDPTHYNYTFYITDASRFDGAVEGVKYVLVADLYSNGAERFNGGQFNVVDFEEATEEDVMGEKVMLGLLFIDLNNDGDFTDANEMQFAEQGSVTASGSGTNYALTFNLTFLENKKFTGTYSGTFQFVDETGGERMPGMDMRKTAKVKWAM